MMRINLLAGFRGRERVGGRADAVMETVLYRGQICRRGCGGRWATDVGLGHGQTWLTAWTLRGLKDGIDAIHRQRGA